MTTLHSLPRLADHPARDHYRTEIAAAKRRGDVEYLACFPLDGKRHRVDEAALLDYSRRKSMRTAEISTPAAVAVQYPTSAELAQRVERWFQKPRRPAATGR